MRLPTYCKNCDLLFASRGIEIKGPARNLNISGNRETCIRCGSMAEMAEGTFDIIDDVIRVINAPDTTVDHLILLKALVEDVRAGRIEPEAAIVEAERIKPGAGKLIRKWMSNNVVGIAALLLAGAMGVHQVRTAAAGTVQMETLIEAVERLEGVARDVHEDGPEKDAKGKK